MKLEIQAPVVVANSTFSRNYASNGGGLWVLGTAVVADSSLSENSARYGGALLTSEKAHLTIQSSRFMRNEATSGGAVYLANHSVTTTHGCAYTGNTAKYGGGLTCSGCHLTTISTSFTQNSATASGGGLAVDTVHDAHVSIVNSTWNNNSAASGAGLAVFYTRSLGSGHDAPSNTSAASLIITANTFTNNNATSKGGGMYLEGLLQVVVANSTFSNNSAVFGGGFFTKETANLTVQDSKFMQNEAATSGGAVYLAINAVATILGCAYTGNHAQYGGGVFCERCLLTTISTSFTNNSADVNGGGLDAINDAHVTVVNSTWHNNTAANGAGLAMINIPSPGVPSNTSATLSIATNSFTNNSATSTSQRSTGGGMYLEGLVKAVAADSKFSQNTADDGGGLVAADKVVVTMQDISFLRNEAADSGGSVCLAAGSTATVHGCAYTGSHAQFGGGIYCEGCNLTTINTTFTSNSGVIFGGAVYAIHGAHVTAVNSTWQNNTAYRGAGLAVACYPCTTAPDGLPAVLSIAGSTFTNNSAADRGGGLYLAQHNVQAVIRNSCRFIGNSAPFGGAINLVMHANLTISNSAVQGNSANIAGGALFQTDTSTVLVTDGSKILDNTASLGGGSYCDGHAQLTMAADSLFQGNSAAKGGGLFAQGTALVIVKNSTLYRNQANSTGGGVSLDGAAHANISGCSVIGNAAWDSGGGLYAIGDAVMVLTDSLVANNTAFVFGGGIRVAGTAKLRLLGDTSVTKNAVNAFKAYGWGGGVSLLSEGFDLTQVMRAVHGNTATYNNNIMTNVTNITVNGTTSVVHYVNSIGALLHEGLLHVAVNVSGYYGLPCPGVDAVATLDDGTFLGLNRSDEYGIAYMSFKVNRPPGLYTVSFWSAMLSGLSAKLNLQIRGCVRGEVTPILDTCQQCQPGYFSFDPQQALCETCPADANCTGGDVILPLPGYWRSSADSMQVHRCPNPNACGINDQAAFLSCAANSTCGASDTFKDLQCSPDYTGNLCGACAAGRGAIKLLVCKPCMATSNIIALYTVAAIVMLLFIKLLCYLTQRQASSVRLGESSKPPAAELLRPLVLYSQYMLIVSSMNIDWPASLSYPLKVLGWVWSPASPETLSIDCILPKSSSLPVSIQKVLFYLCMPVALLLLLMLIELASLGVKSVLLPKRAGRHATATDLKDQLLSNTLVAIFFFLPSVLRTLFSMFACTLIDQPAAPPYASAAVGSFWVFDINQQCFSGYHRAWALGLGLPLVLLVCLGSPCGLLWLLLRNNANLHEESFMQQYGFLHKSYRDRCCCWECVVVCQTILLVATSVFGANLGVFYQLIVINGVFMLILGMLLVCKPYLYPQAGRIMLQAICCLLLTSYVSLTFLQVGSVQPSPIYRLVMGSILLVVNLVFVMSVLWQLACLVDWQGLASIMQRFVHRLLHGFGLFSTPQVVHSKAAPAPVNV